MNNTFSCTGIKCGHIVTDGGSITFTSADAANGLIEILATLVESMAKDISDITGIPIENVINDYKKENELDLMTAAFNAVLRRKGYKIEQTPTRCVINRIIKEQNNNQTKLKGR